MKLVKKKENQIIFEEKIDESLVNAIRRYVNEIPILAVDEVEISKNDSPLYDETIANRLGLIPLKMEKVYGEKDLIESKLVVKKEGIVYSKDLKGHIKAVYENIPITTIGKDQEIEILAKARLGKGNEHAKFSPGLIFYRNKAEIKIDKGCKMCGDCVDACPKNVFKIKNNKIVVENSEKCDLCDVCIEVCKKQGKNCIQITPTKELIISIESFGQLKIKDILNKAIKELKKDLAEVSKKVEK